MSYTEFVRRGFIMSLIVMMMVFFAIAVWELASILLITFACWVLAVGLDSLSRMFQRVGLPRTLSVALTLIATLLFTVVLAAIVLPPFFNQITDLLRQIPEVAEGVVRSYETLRNEFAVAQQMLPEFTIEDYESIFATDLEEAIAGAGVETDGSTIELGTLLGSTLPILQGIGSMVGNVLANLTIISMITLYLLMEPNSVYQAIIAVVPARHEQRAVEIMEEVRRTTIAWLGTRAISTLVTGLAVWLVLGIILGIPNAVALGVIAALAGFIPNLGYYLGALPIIIFTATYDINLVIPVYFLYWVINEVEGKVLSPAIIKHELAIPAGFILPFQLVGAAIFGFLGLLLAVPIMAIGIILVREIYVFDTLGKRGQTPQIVTANDGTLSLLYPALDEPQEASGQTMEPTRQPQPPVNRETPANQPST